MKAPLTITTVNTVETKKLGVFFAETISEGSKKNQNALVISLEGDLGSGKTTFTQGFAEELGIKEKIQSPTFVILKIYNLPKPACRQAGPLLRKEEKTRKINYHRYFIHIDAYRIGAQDLQMLRWKELVADPKNIILVEWGDRIKKILPKGSMHVIFKHLKGDQRRILFKQ